MAQIIESSPYSNLASAFGHTEDDYAELDSGIDLSEVSEDGGVSTFAAGGDNKVSPVAMGDKDMQSIFYINMKPENLTSEQSAELKKRNEQMAWTTQWMSLKTGQTVQAKMSDKSLPGDGDLSNTASNKRATYRAKVTEVLMNKINWMNIYGQNFVGHKITTEQRNFHASLVKIIVEGLNVPSDIAQRVEKILQSIAKQAEVAKELKDQTMMWILITLYEWDPMLRVMRSRLRSVYFELTPELKVIIKGGKKGGEDRTISVDFKYNQIDSNFNYQIWESGVGTQVENFVKGLNTPVINDPVDVPV